eukprot:scaffold71863_cov18-Prasinocladus_malaysianus.AAC.1
MLAWHAARMHLSHIAAATTAETPPPGSLAEAATAMIDKAVALFHEFYRANTFKDCLGWVLD